MVALPALVSGLDAELVRLGYKDSTMVWYRGCWRRLQKYFAARGAGEFSLGAAGLSASTVRTYGTLAGEFVAFTGTRGGLACCDANMIGAFVATLAGYQFKTVEQKLCAVRSFR